MCAVERGQAERLGAYTCALHFVPSSLHDHAESLTDYCVGFSSSLKKYLVKYLIHFVQKG